MSQRIRLAWQSDRKSVVHKSQSPSCSYTWVNSAEVWLVKLTVAEQRDRKMLQGNVNRAIVEIFACQGQILHCTVFNEIKWRNTCLHYIPFYEWVLYYKREFEGCIDK